MKNPDPIEALQSFYGRLEPETPPAVEAIYRRQSRRRQKLTGAVCGCSVGLLAALVLTSWASRPVAAPRGSAQAIARYQMMNSGLVQKGAPDLLEGVR